MTESSFVAINIDYPLKVRVIAHIYYSTFTYVRALFFSLKHEFRSLLAPLRINVTRDQSNAKSDEI